MRYMTRSKIKYLWSEYVVMLLCLACRQVMKCSRWGEGLRFLSKTMRAHSSVTESSAISSSVFLFAHFLFLWANRGWRKGTFTITNSALSVVRKLHKEIKEMGFSLYLQPRPLCVYPNTDIDAGNFVIETDADTDTDNGLAANHHFLMDWILSP